MSRVSEALRLAGSDGLKAMAEDGSGTGYPPAGKVGSSGSQGASSAEPHASTQTHTALFRRVPVNFGPQHPLLPFHNDGTFYASEQYRILRTKLIQHPRAPKMLVVSSAGPGDGKSTTAINLAGALALKSDATVLLIDADLRRSSISGNLGLPQGPGLNQILRGTGRPQDAIVVVEQLTNLHVLPAGERQGNPTELLGSSAWAELCASLRQQFRYIIIDCPPIGALADFDLIQATSDAVVFVVRPDRTKRPVCLKALKAIPKDRLMGVVLNCVPQWFMVKHDPVNYGYYDLAASRETAGLTARR